MELIIVILSLIAFAAILLGYSTERVYKWHQWQHRRVADRRIIRQAKAAGVWDKTPIVLGGRALELKAWQDYKIKREPGETDAHLRFRCMNAAQKDETEERKE